MMGRCLVAVPNPEDPEDRLFVVWSTVVSAPVSLAHTRDEFWRAIMEEASDEACLEASIEGRTAEGLQRLRELKRQLASARLERLDRLGTTMIGDTSWEDTAGHNRAGPGESSLDHAGLWAWCLANRANAPLNT